MPGYYGANLPLLLQLKYWSWILVHFCTSSKCSDILSYSKQQLKENGRQNCSPFLGYYWRNEYEHQCLALTRAMWAIRSRTRLLSKRTKSVLRVIEGLTFTNDGMKYVEFKRLPVAPFVVIPRHELHERRAQSNTSLGIKDA